MYEIYNDDCLERLDKLEENSIDCIVTDPPYLLSFMGKEWDMVDKIDPAFGFYFAGLTDGEGCFRIHKEKGGEYYACMFQLKLRKDDKAILEKVQKTLGIGCVRDVAASGNSKPLAAYFVQSREECNKLAQVFLKFPLQAKKQRDFFKWYEALTIWNNQKRGNRWHGKTDVSAMEQAWLEMKKVREYTENPEPVNPQEFFHYLWAKRCFRVLKPGGYLLSFAGTRTYHRMASAIEDAGFEIRDMVNWVYGSGMPKGLNIGLAVDKKRGVASRVVGETRIGKTSLGENSGWDTSDNMKAHKQGGIHKIKEAQNEWKGWSSQLKPSHEPIVIAQKSIKGKIVDNVLEWGVGGYNIDECRVSHNEPQKTTNRKPRADREVFNTKTSGFNSVENHTASANPEGRYPANVILSYNKGDEKETCGGFPQSKGGHAARYFKNCPFEEEDLRSYYYSAKASKKDRDEGLDNFEAKAGHTKGNGLDRICEFCGVSQLTPELCHCEKKSWVAKPKRNAHPTVKPTELMRYLVRLVAPKGATILDPFMGSGSTGKAVMLENAERNANYKFVGIEKEQEYYDIAKARIGYEIKKYNLESRK